MTVFRRMQDLSLRWALIVVALAIAILPVTAQTAIRIFGTVSGAPIALQADSNGQLKVTLGADSTLPGSTDIDAGTGTAVAGIGGTLTVDTTQAATGANTTETDLWTYSLPANTLSADNYGVRVELWYSTAANANNKTVRPYWGGTALDTFTAASNNAVVVVRFEIWRTAAGAQRTFMEIEAPSAGARNTSATHTRDETAAQVIKFTGQNGTASAGDIVFHKASVEFLRAGS